MAVASYPVFDERGQSRWPEKFPQEELELKRQLATDLRFAREFELNPIRLEGSALLLEWLRLYDREDLPAQVDYYFGVDPSISGRGDYMAICVLAKAPDGRMYLRDFVRERAAMERMITLIERTARIYAPLIQVNVEAVQAQALLVQELQNRTTLPVRSYLPRGRKEDRISLMAQLYFSTGKVLVRGRTDPERGLVPDDSMDAFIAEWVAFDPRRREQRDDALDACGAAVDCASSSGMAACVSSEWRGADGDAEGEQEEISESEEQEDEESETGYVPVWGRRWL